MTLQVADDFRAKSYDVFVSYKREDDDARAVLVTALESAGYNVFWDTKLNHDDWKGELRDEINRSTMVICLWSAEAAASDNVKAEAFHAFGIKKLLSAYVEDRSVVPDYFENTNLHSFDGWEDDSRRGAQIAKILATLERVTGGPSRKSNEATNAPMIPVEWGDIPGAPPRLIGRDDEMLMLKAASESRAPRKVNAVVLHALGGAGKSALLRTFANELVEQGGCGATRIYGWSAYSQGSGEQKRADADGFISKALGDFGFQGKLPSDPVERARELARLIQRERVLLLLDGLEPLQDPPNVNKGRFKDKGLAELVKVLASQNAGLVVLTTRQEIPELEGHGALVINRPLDQLSEPAGAELLVELGVRGRQRELEEAVRAVDGHALSVTLLGAYLTEICGGDIRHRDQFDFADIVLTQAEEEELATDKTIKPAKRAAKVMRSYLERFDWLAANSAATGLGGTERVLLYLLGLFDRPADGQAIEALLQERIPGLTDELFFDTVTKTSGWWLFKSRKVEIRELTVSERSRRIRRAKEVLRKLRLFSRPNPDDPHELDAHPIVRAYFSGRLETTASEPAKAAHRILYRHYASDAPDLPVGLEEMEPLFHAVQHGVKGGLTQEAFHDVFLRRIHRHESYLFRFLGAFGQNLTILSYFFDAPWRTPRSDLTSTQHAWLLAQAAYSLKSLGRLKDAIAPRRSSIDLEVQAANWEGATNLASSLCQELLLLGEILSSMEIGSIGIEYSGRGESNPASAFCIADYAYALAQYGDIETACDKMREVDKRQDGSERGGYIGYKSGDLLLALGQAEAVQASGEAHLADSVWPLEFAFAHLLVGRAQDALGNPDAALSLDMAVARFRQAGAMHLLPVALLARAAHRRLRAASEADVVARIREDLGEVEDIAGDDMKLYLTDLALERACLALDIPSAFASPEAARAEAETKTAWAAELIAETDYHRRDPELAELQIRLAAAGPQSPDR